MGWSGFRWGRVLTTMKGRALTIGSFVFAVGTLLFLINCWKSYRTGAQAGNNPWDAPTLEWATPSPPPPYNFAVVPTVASRHPLWEDRLQESEALNEH